MTGVTHFLGPCESNDKNRAYRKPDRVCSLLGSLRLTLRLSPQRAPSTACVRLGQEDPGVAKEGARAVAANPEACLYPKMAVRKTRLPLFVGDVNRSTAGGRMRGHSGGGGDHEGQAEF